MALIIPSVDAEMAPKGACGEPGKSTGPQSNEFLKLNADCSLGRSPMMSPLSQASTAPPSPTPSGGSSVRFGRLVSFELDHAIDFPIDEDFPPSVEQLEQSLSDLKELYKAKFGQDADVDTSDDDEQCEPVVERDGVTWTVTRGTLPSIEQLEQSLSDAKALYEAKFGQVVDAEEADDQEQSEQEVEKDGVTWMVTRGAPPSVEQLEESLADVKALYNAKFGQDVDAEEADDFEECEEEVEKGGVVNWMVTRGAPPSVEQLEESLADVKALYKAKFGQDFDAEEADDFEECEEEVEKDGVTWTVTRGATPSVEQLEQSLADVKTLYKAKFGLDVDSEEADDDESEEEVEKDGVSWTVTRGAPPSVEQLEQSLADVKSLYKAKFGLDFDAEEADDDEESEHTVEKDGVTWTVTRGAPPSVDQLEQSLADVKSLYKAKFGQDVDDEEADDDEESEEEVEKDGVTWTVTRGTPPSVEKLEQDLADVKTLYKAKFGQDVDDEASDDVEQCEEEVAKDGVTWTVTRGAPPSVEKLEQDLADVKALYKAKFGQDVDAETSDDEVQCDEEGKKDGVTWTVTRGAPPSNDQLEQSLADVKALYKAKFGQDVDSEESDYEEQSEEEVAKDGVTWTVTRGAAPSVEQLEENLADVKALYKAKFGQDVDDEASDDEEQCNEEVAKDSVTWTVTRGAPPSVEKLEQSLSDVKALYKAKFSQDVDAETSDDEEQCESQQDGITWIVSRGSPPSAEKLEQDLADVKALYKAKFGQDVDSETSDDEEQSEEEVEKDGVTWTVTRGAPPSVDQLEQGLSDVKALYKAKFGQDVDAEEPEQKDQSDHAVEKEQKSQIDCAVEKEKHGRECSARECSSCTVS